MSSNGSILLPIKVNGYRTHAVVDTGAQATILSERVASRLERPLRYQGKVQLKGPDEGSYIPARMSENAELFIGDHLYHWHVYVAPIRDDIILGLDFVAHFGMDIKLSDRCLQIGQEEIPFNLAGSPKKPDSWRVARILADQDITVPPQSGRNIQVPSPGTRMKQLQVFEPLDRGSAVMASSLFEGGEMVPITILNFGDQPLTISKGEVLGAASEAMEPESINRESSAQVEKVIRRIKVRDADNTFPAVQSKLFAQVSESLPEHLRDLFFRSSKKISFIQALELANLLSEFQDCFSRNDTDLGLCKTVYHWIPTGNAKAVRQSMRRTPLHLQSLEKEQLHNMKQAGVIEDSSSDWASPVCIVKKRSGGIRYCSDSRALNAVTVKDAYPLPRISECYDALSGNKFFSQYDLNSGFWQIEIAPEDRHKTAFLTRHGLFQYARMPFGLCNAPATFQRAMQHVLKGLLWKDALAFMDDVMSLGVDFGHALTNIRKVLERFREHGLKLKPRKCAFLQTEVIFLGHKVSEDGIAVNPEHIEAIAKWKIPKTKQQVESFLGYVNYHRDHIKDCAGIADCLYKLAASVKRGPVKMEEQHVEAFHALRQALQEAPTLPFPDPDYTFILDCDASDHSIGCELSQCVDGVERVIAFGSRTMTPEQRRYCTTRKELLAVITFTRQFRHYLLGRPFVCRTDHSSLTWLLTFRNVEGQLARWMEELSQYDITIQHRPGKRHVNADTMSRLEPEEPYCPNYRAQVTLRDLPCFADGSCAYCTRMQEKWRDFEEEVDYVVPLTVRQITKADLADAFTGVEPSEWSPQYTTEELRQKQQEDPDLSDLLRWMESGQDPSQAELMLSSPATKHYWRARSQLTLKQGVLFYQWEDPLYPALLLVVPQSLQGEILEQCHDTRDYGHMGEKNTFEKVKSSFFWYQMRAACSNFVRTCAACSLNKKPRRRRKAAMQSYHAGAPMERVHIDILGPFTKSSRGNTVILMVIDQFTKWLECYPLPNQTASRVARAVVDEFISRFGCPLTIHTDQGTNFTSGLFVSVCQLLQINKTRTTGYRPCSNGQVERMNRTLLQMIRCLQAKNVRNWDEYLPQLAGAIRATVNRSTGFTPNKMMLGREVNKPADIVFGVAEANSLERSESEHVQHLTQVLQETHQLARENLRANQERQKMSYDSSKYQAEYNEGDLVYLRDERTRVGLSKKLLPVYSGPYLVVQVISPILFRLQGRKKEAVVHHDRIIPCRDRTIPLWLQKLQHKFLQNPDQFGSHGRSATEQGISALFEEGASPAPEDHMDDSAEGPEKDQDPNHQNSSPDTTQELNKDDLDKEAITPGLEDLSDTLELEDIEDLDQEGASLGEQDDFTDDDDKSPEKVPVGDPDQSSCVPSTPADSFSSCYDQEPALGDGDDGPEEDQDRAEEVGGAEAEYPSPTGTLTSASSSNKHSAIPNIKTPRSTFGRKKIPNVRLKDFIL